MKSSPNKWQMYWPLSSPLCDDDGEGAPRFCVCIGCFEWGYFSFPVLSHVGEKGMNQGVEVLMVYAAKGMHFEFTIMAVRFNVHGIY